MSVFLYLFRFMRILVSDVVLFRSGTEKQLLRSPSVAEKFTLKFFFLFFFVLFFSFFCFCPASEKRSLRQRMEIADVHTSAQPSRDLSTNILSVSLCLQFFLSSRSRPPALLPCSAPIGSRSCSTGRLLAPSHGNLAGAARICPRTSRSPAFCPWTDDTESEARDRR